MPYSLKNRRVLVTGGSRGLGALLATCFAAEGCDVAINYLSSKDAAEKVLAEVQAKGRKGVLIQGDAGVKKDCTRMVEETVKNLGGIDLILANAGWTKFTNFGDLESMNEDEWDKCWATNTKSPLHLLQAALAHFKENPEGGQLLLSSSIAGVMPSGSSMAYSVSKAAGLHLMQCLAQTQGPKVRVNAVLPGLLLTEWGQQFAPEHIKRIQDTAVLKRETELQDVVDAFLAFAKNPALTGVKTRVDSGYAIRY